MKKIFHLCSIMDSETQLVRDRTEACRHVMQATLDNRASVDISSYFHPSASTAITTSVRVSILRMQTFGPSGDTITEAH